MFAPLWALDTATAIFDPSFRSLKMQKMDAFMDIPSIRLGSSEKIIVNFDELSEVWSELQCRLIHCNADWQPSALVESEFVAGFNLADISDYAFSSNTFIHFVNYRFEIPSPDLEPLRDGNYLAQVFRRDDPDSVILQFRFQVYTGSAHIAGSASGRTDRGINDQWQQLDFRVSFNPNEVQNPYQDLSVYITQNGDPNSRRRIARPLRAEGNSLVFESLPDLIFPAGNEFRRFETVRTDYPGLGVDSVSFSGSNYHAYLQKADVRASHPYIYDQTQHGRFIIDEYNSTDPDLGADYVTVHFLLDAPEIIDGDIFVNGEFSHFNLSEPYRMKYSFDSGLYHLQLPLKQGSYNYRFVALPRNASGPSDPSPIEGNFADTQNEYNISVFLRTPTARADRLVGSATIVSHR
ncbi:MAG: DUF5103 domain-containing protein [Muribaculum sp.]|nr:DUF5103 domain-containing protein [Muribaculum sp.]